MKPANHIVFGALVAILGSLSGVAGARGDGVPPRPSAAYEPPNDLPYGARGYYPSAGRRPGYGRQEVEPPVRVLPPPAPTYHRSWSTGSGPEPATVNPPYQPPEVNVMPRAQRQDFRRPGIAERRRDAATERRRD